MKLVLLFGALALASAAPDGYHYNPPAVSSTLYFPSVPSSVAQESDDCEEPAPQPPVFLQQSLPLYAPVPNQQPSQLYQFPLKTTVVQPLKTQVTFSTQHQLGHSYQQQQQHGWNVQQQASSSGWKYTQPAKPSVLLDQHHHQQQSSIWVKPQSTVEEVYKHVYVHVPPEDKEEYEPPRVVQPAAHKQTHYKIIFIKAPNHPQPKSVVLPPQPQNEEKTIVYVLHQKPEQKQEVILQPPEPAKQNKPEVYFIKYRNKDEHKSVQLVASTVAPAVSHSDSASLSVVSNEQSSAYSSGSSGSSYSYVSSTPAPVKEPVTPSYSYVSSTPAPAVVYSTSSSHSGGGSSSNGYSSGSSYSSFSQGSGQAASGYESYVDLGNSGYSSFSSSGGNQLGVINVASADYVPVVSTTVAPLVKVLPTEATYVSTTPHSVVSSTVGLLEDVAIKNPGLSGYSSQSVPVAKKKCRRCSSTTSAPLKVVQDAYVSNLY
ncbi:uncharacterized protein LOC128739319 [Sabethes cyaneus]|uniref:uncharacterized protein LOC128739319 n=1 Tax=Sabethes cyaneus TaxID=53552 RepID=UPI00237E1125|nr:uncharacterized protein LOC128739319 [Sabethes cyaneus]